MNCSTELFQDLVQIADSFHSVASGLRWFCIAILRGEKGMHRRPGSCLTTKAVVAMAMI